MAGGGEDVALCFGGKVQGVGAWHALHSSLMVALMVKSLHVIVLTDDESWRQRGQLLRETPWFGSVPVTVRRQGTLGPAQLLDLSTSSIEEAFSLCQDHGIRPRHCAWLGGLEGNALSVEIWPSGVST